MPRASLLPAFLLAFPAALFAQAPAGTPASPTAPRATAVWKYPCSFTLGGKPWSYAKVPQGLECDFLRAQNGQKTTILQATDPKHIAGDVPHSQRLEKLLNLRNKAAADGSKACAPFFWEKREETSYLTQTDGYWPKSWAPCMEPFYARMRELEQLIRPEESAVVSQANAQVQAKLRAGKGVGTLANGLRGGLDVEQGLQKAFDGGAHAGAAPSPASPPAPGAPPATTPQNPPAAGGPA
ncbi:MAG: hypothetical protein NTX64_11695, partial [Elusimicrobia bacterium]|nr:hypothetical protein [Elusimicrobiota bacterium]